MADTAPIYAIGDLHGRSDEFDRLTALIEADGGKGARVVFLGDLTDRGPDSRGVIQRLLDGVAAGRDWICLLGNHDRMFRRYLVAGQENDRCIGSGLGWLNPRLGGLATLQSYGLGPFTAPRFKRTPEALEYLVEIGTPEGRIGADELLAAARQAVPQAHRDFLAARPLWHREAGLLFVHAGIRPDVPLEGQAEDDLVWIREPFLSHDGEFGALVVHGHTALEAATHFGNRVDLDSGAGYGAPASAAVFQQGWAWLLTEGGRVLLAPPGAA